MQRRRFLIIALCMALAAILSLPAVAYASSDGTAITISSDNTEVQPGDTVTFEITLGPVSQMGTMQMVLDIPEGLSFVEGSFEDGLKEKLGFDYLEEGVKDNKKMLYGVASKADYSSNEATPLYTFTCTVGEGFSGTAEIGLTNLEFYSCKTWKDHTSEYSVVNAKLSSASAETPEDPNQGGNTTEPAESTEQNQGGNTTEPVAPNQGGSETPDNQGGNTTESVEPTEQNQGGNTTRPTEPVEHNQGGNTTEPVMPDQGGSETPANQSGNTTEPTQPAEQNKSGSETPANQGGSITEPSQPAEQNQGVSTTEPVSTNQGGSDAPVNQGGNTSEPTQPAEQNQGGSINTADNNKGNSGSQGNSSNQSDPKGHSNSEGKTDENIGQNNSGSKDTQTPSKQGSEGRSEASEGQQDTQKSFPIWTVIPAAALIAIIVFLMRRKKEN